MSEQNVNAGAVVVNAAKEVVSTIEQIANVPVTPMQAKAIRKLALGSNKKSATELAADLFGQVIRGRFKAKAEAAGDDAGAKYDLLLASGLLTEEFKKQMPTRAAYISKAKAEYAEILAEL